MDLAFVGRQAILDRNLSLHAYELLFRAANGDRIETVGGNRATGEVLLAAFAELGLQRVVGRARAFVNFTRDLLLEGAERLPLPPERVALEVLEDVAVDSALVSAVSDLSQRGYTIALDDFEYHQRWQPLLPLTDVVKLDVRALSPSQIEHHIELLRPFGAKLLAEKVETRSEYEWLRELGFDYFQGFFLGRPEIITGRRQQADRTDTLKMLHALQDPQQTLERIEAIVRCDVAISYKLMRLVDSSACVTFGKGTSLRSVVDALGLENTRKFASLIALTRLENKPAELMRLTLVRARMCELLAGEREKDAAARFFTVGLFSTLDAMLDTPLAEVLQELPLSHTIRDALLEQRGREGQILQCVLAYERCEFAEICLEGRDASDLAAIYADAVEWSFRVSDGISQPPEPPSDAS